MKVAVLGANGQIGSEICLILRSNPDVSLVPICRNHMGSAFLRSKGIACRHGLPTDDNQVAMLINDCPVIVNLALGSGSLREASDANKRLIRNSIEFSPDNATILHFSTVSVYGDPYPDTRIRWKNSYAREKLRCDRLAIKLGRKFGKKVYVLRLGHVCGDLQGITSVIREDILNGAVALPAPNQKANVVYMATIVNAILKAVSGELGKPGIYDLLNNPQWTWKEVYEYEAENSNSQLIIDPASIEVPKTRVSLINRIVSSISGVLLSNQMSKEYAMQIIARLSPKLNKRIQAIYYKNRAAKEISELNKRVINNDALKWREVGWNYLSALDQTKDIVGNKEYNIQDENASISWPEDMEVLKK